MRVKVKSEHTVSMKQVDNLPLQLKIMSPSKDPILI